MEKIGFRIECKAEVCTYMCVPHKGRSWSGKRREQTSSSTFIQAFDPTNFSYGPAKIVVEFLCLVFIPDVPKFSP